MRNVVYGIIIGFILGASLYALFSSPLSDPATKFLRLGEGTFTNPLLECDASGDVLSAQKINFKNELDDYVAPLQQKNGVEKVAVYFRDLNNGPTFGIEYNSPFVPASLLKVPIMMALYKTAETNPEILKKEILFSQDNAPEAEVLVPLDKRLENGKKYPIEELIERMIMYSDNQSMLLLAPETPIQNMIRLFTIIGVDKTILDDSNARLSAKEYSAFFRILYNASFLDQTYSEKALALLTKTYFTEGLQAGVPPDVTVAHKFGERNEEKDAVRYLHDCGIVYYPKHPYTLCIMTQGDDIAKMQESLAHISAFVYEKIDAEYQEKK